MKEKLRLFALTGGIGSGKSFALNVLKDGGYKTLSCDSVVATLYRKRKVLKELKRAFPTAVTGRFFYKANKKEIANIVFNDKTAYNTLSEILTLKAFYKTLKIAKSMGGTVFVEVPLLFEFNLSDYFERVIVITRDIDERINAVIKRSKLTREQVEKRIDSQLDYDKKDLSAYITVENDGTGNFSKNLLLAVKSIL